MVSAFPFCLELLCLPVIFCVFMQYQEFFFSSVKNVICILSNTLESMDYFQQQSHFVNSNYAKLRAQTSFQSSVLFNFTFQWFIIFFFDVLIYFLVAVINLLSTETEGREGLSHSSRLESTVARNAQEQVLEAADCILCLQQEERDECMHVTTACILSPHASYHCVHA